ncbi:MAG: M13 family metallopeptidase [Clostridia bacterium]|nr:M13 family metallopeptidase [Clostridia bacterium]
MRKWMTLLLCVLLAMALIAAVLPSAIAENGKILDGRWLCSDIAGNVTEDTPAELKDDFGLYVNKPWILQARFASGVPTVSNHTEIQFEVMDRLFALMKDGSLAGHDAELVHKLYALTADWDQRNAQGVSPALPYMQAIAEIDSLDTLMQYLCSADRLTSLVPFNAHVMPNGTDPAVYVVYVEPSQLMLDDPEEYVERTEYGQAEYDRIRQIAGYVLARLDHSESEIDLMLDNAIAFEGMLASCCTDDSEDVAEGEYTPEALAELAGPFPILDMLKAIDMYSEEDFYVVDPDYFTAFQTVFTEENVPLVRDWLAIDAAMYMIDLLDEEAAMRQMAVNVSTMGGGETNPDLSVYAVMTRLLPVPLDNLYIQAYCTQQQRQNIIDIVDEILAAYRAMLGSEDWLSEQTRAAAIEKLDALRVHAVYPEVLGDWSALDFAGPEDGGSLLEAARTIDRYLQTLMISKVGTVMEKAAWDQLAMTSYTVNGLYKPSENDITITAGILGGEYYNENMSYEQMLGGIGMIIGHEITHAFDIIGARYDKNGALANWWTDEDHAAFEARAGKLADWYDGFIPCEGVQYSGRRVQREAIPDLGSMKCMLSIAAQKDDFDYDAFFRQWARALREQSSPEMIRENALYDSHPLNYMRINATLAQFEAFVDLYGIKEGDGMYIAPEDRLEIW